MKTIGIIGAGSAATAIVRGVLNAELVAREQIIVTNKSDDDKLTWFARQFGVQISRQMDYICDNADTIVIAVKPDSVADAVSALNVDDHLLISIAAAIPCSYIEGLATGAAVVRAMPNVCCQVGAGVTAIARGRHVRSEHLSSARSLFGACGFVVTVSEQMMDLVTAISGSGPAYVALLCQLLEQSAVKAGLDRQQARVLVEQTFVGTAKMLADCRSEDILQAVTTPGGTTMAALQVMEDNQIADMINEAVGSATERSREIMRSLVERQRCAKLIAEK